MSLAKVLGKVMGTTVTGATVTGVTVIGTREEEISKNLRLYIQFQKRGFHYIYNPDTYELHDLKANNFYGSHNLKTAHLEKFIAIWDLKYIYWFEGGIDVPIYNYDNPSEQLDPFRNLPNTYRLNQCKVCFPDG